MKIIIIISFGLLLTGCTRTISREEFYIKCKETYNPYEKISGDVTYCGSKNGYDYLCFRKAFWFNDSAKIKTGEIFINKYFQYSRYDYDWIVIYPYRDPNANSHINQYGVIGNDNLEQYFYNDGIREHNIKLFPEK